MSYNIKNIITVGDEDEKDDHRFCGIMFDVEVKTHLPVLCVTISSVWVRGQLGDMTIWVCPGGHLGSFRSRDLWRNVFNSIVPSSERQFVPLVLSESIPIRPGERLGITHEI